MRTRSQAAVIVAALAVGTSACGGDFDSYNLLNSLRILAVQAEPPVIGPGQNAELEALVFTPDASTPDYAWSWCPFTLPREQGFECAVSQEELQAAVDEQIGAGFVTVPSFDLGSAATATLPYLADPQVLQGFCAAAAANATAVSAIQTCDTAFEVTVRVEVSAGAERVTAIKRVDLAFDAANANNANPTLGLLRAAAGEEAREEDAVLLPSNGSGALTADTTHRLWVDISDLSAESFVPPPDPATPDVVPDARQETLYLTWFVTGGETDDERTSFIDGEVEIDILRENAWTLPPARDIDGGRASIYLVLRDERGGVAWSSYDVSTPAAQP